jgi:hypothetical protein
MRLGKAAETTFSIARRDARIPIEVAVYIAGSGAFSARESTFTQDVSAGGASVLSTRRWKKNQRLTITACAGGFQSIARVVYCKPIPGTGFVLGLELLAPSGKWIVSREGVN